MAQTNCLVLDDRLRIRWVARTYIAGSPDEAIGRPVTEYLDAVGARDLRRAVASLDGSRSRRVTLRLTVDGQPHAAIAELTRCHCEKTCYVLYGVLLPEALLTLTSRQLDVLWRLPRQPLKKIAAELGVSRSTVASHARLARQKLGAASLTELVVLATRWLEA